MAPNGVESFVAAHVRRGSIAATAEVRLDRLSNPTIYPKIDVRRKRFRSQRYTLLHPKQSVTEDEGILLAFVVRAQPITAYQIAKFHDDSPVSNFNTSKGKIYPTIRRLRAVGLLKSRAVPRDARGTELLEITKKGEKALRAWIREIRPSHLLPEDSVRTRLQSLGLLTRDEKIEWISEVKMQLLRKLEDVEQYNREVSLPYHDLVKQGAISSLRNRMDWLDLLLSRVVLENDKS